MQLQTETSHSLGDMTPLLWPRAFGLAWMAGIWSGTKG